MLLAAQHTAGEGLVQRRITIALAGYDGNALLGDAIASGTAASNVASAGWVAEKGTDLYVVINPCK